MPIKIILLILVFIFTLIAAFLFSIAGLLLGAPELLMGPLNSGIAAGCIAVGIILMIPLLAGVSIAVANLIHPSKSNQEKRKPKKSAWERRNTEISRKG